ncbi:hypothetical protein QBC39DRAFT_137554 [Podospora conica]|nr:hypothetical protein QBC39DRAFT_137554 [Schizothecium conicum]
MALRFVREESRMVLGGEADLLRQVLEMLVRRQALGRSWVLYSGPMPHTPLYGIWWFSPDAIPFPHRSTFTTPPSVRIPRQHPLVTQQTRRSWTPLPLRLSNNSLLSLNLLSSFRLNPPDRGHAHHRLQLSRHQKSTLLPGSGPGPARFIRPSRSWPGTGQAGCRSSPAVQWLLAHGHRGIPYLTTTTISDSDKCSGSRYGVMYGRGGVHVSPLDANWC